MTSLFKSNKLIDIALSNIAVQIILEIIKLNDVSGRIPSSLIPALEELLEDYDSYKNEHGSLALICRLYNNIQDNHQKAFYWEIIEPELMKPELHKNAFVTACEYGNFLTVQCLYELATTELKIDMLKARNFLAFRLACQNGHQQIATWLYGLATQELKKSMLLADRFYAFRFACENGHQQIAQWLYGLATTELKIGMLVAENFYAFRCACQNGQQQTAQWLYGLATLEQQKKAMLEADNFGAFLYACNKWPSTNCHMALWPTAWIIRATRK